MKRFTTLLVLVSLVLLLVQGASAQVITNYGFSGTSGTYTALAGGTTMALSGGSVDDGYFNSVPIGFTFYYMGLPYTTLSVTTNGWLTFGQTLTTSGASNALATGTPRPVVAPLWDDLDIQANTNFSYLNSGPDGNQILTLEFLNMQWNYNATGNTISFQVILHQSTGAIDFVYRPEGGTISSASASIGICGILTGSGNFLSLDGTGVSPTASSITETTTLATAPASGQMYTFTPVQATTPAAPIAMTFSSVTGTGMTMGWTDNSSTETYFTVTRATDPGFTTNVVTSTVASTTTPGTGTTYSSIQTGLAFGTTYYFKVTANNEGSAPSGLLTGNQATSAGTLSGSYTVGTGGNYDNLTLAFAAVNNSGLAGNTTFQLISGYPAAAETYPIAGPSAGAVGAYTLTIYPTVSGLSITSSNTTGTLDLNGCKNIILDGRVGGTGSAKDLVLENTATAGVALRYINDAVNNTIKYCVVKGVNTSTTGGVILFSTAAAGITGNDNNTIDNCDIRDGLTTPANGIYALGTTTTAALNNSGNTISNCSIFNFFAGGTASNGILLSSGNTDWNITGNSFFQTATRTGTAGSTHSGITISNSSSGNNFLVSGNYIGGSAANAGGTAWTMGGSFANRFIGIQVSVGSTTPSSLQNNTIANFSWTSTSGATTLPGVWCGIYLSAGNANIGNVAGNTIGSGTGTGSISLVTSTTGGISVGIGDAASSSTVNISNNSIGSVNLFGSTASISHLFTGIWTTSGSTLTISNNTIGSISTASSICYVPAGTGTTATTITGINNSSGATLAVSNNTVANLTNNYTGTGSGQVRGIVTISGINTITGNTVRNLFSAASNSSSTSSASGIGIVQTSTTAGQTVSGNTIHSITVNPTTATTAIQINGIYYSGPSTGTNIIARNLIHSFSTNSTAPTANSSGTINGIHVFGGVSTYQNNMVRVGVDAAGADVSGNYIIAGIRDNATAANNFYHNSIYVGGGSVAGSANSFGYIRASTGVSDFRDNVVVNNRSNSSGTGKHYAMGLNAITTFTTNYNVYHGTGTGFVFGYIGTPGTTDYADFSAWKGGSSQDANSAFGDPKFVAPTGTFSTVDLHIQPSAPTPVEGSGTLIASVVDDFDGQTRSGLTPVDIGADAGNFLGLDLAPPFISYTPLTFTNSTSNRSFTGVTITDASGVNTTAGTMPRVYYKKSTNANAWVDNTSATDGWKYVEANGVTSPFDFTIDYSKLFSTGTVTIGDFVQYFVVAQDLATTPNVGINSGLFAAPPSGVALTAAAFPVGGTVNQYKIVDMPLSGDYTVGTTLFNRVTGKNVMLEARTRKVMRELLVPIPDETNINGKRETPRESTPEPASFASRFTKVMRLVEETYYVPMENGAPYNGPLFVKRIDNPNLPSEVLSGIYLTIGAAVTDAAERGVGGPVRFLLIDASYTGETLPITIGAIPGTSATNTVTIKPTVASSISGSSASAIFKLNGADYVTIDGAVTGTSKDLSIGNTSTATSSAVIWVASTAGGDGATNNTIKNCVLTGGSTSALACIASSGSAIGGVAEAANSNNTYRNNTLGPAYNCIAVVGPGTPESGTVITQNTVGTVTNAIGYRGMHIANENAATITGNTVQNVVTTSSSAGAGGIALVGVTTGVTVSNNTLTNISSSASSSGTSSVTALYIGTTSTATTVRANTVTGIASTTTGGYGVRGIIVLGSGTAIYNNMISDIYNYQDATPTSYATTGISLDGAINGITVYHNTVNLFGSHPGYSSNTTGGVSTCLYVNTTTNAGVDVRDNVFSNSYDNSTSTGDKSYAVYCLSANTVFTNMDYNDYFVSGTGSPVMGYIGTDRVDLAGMIAGFGGNAGSVAGDPKLLTNTNLHINTIVPSPVDNTGFFLAGVVTDDIDGDPRVGPTNADMGADEFTYSPPAVLDPTGVTATAISATQIDVAFTPNASTNPVVVVWNLTGTFTAPSGVPSIGGSLAGGTVLSIGITSPVSHTSLSSATHYFYRAFSYEGTLVLYSPGVSVDATTMFAPITSYPYNQGFEDVTFPPTGWVRQDVNGGNTWQRSISSQRTGVACAYYPYNSSFAADDWLFTPPLALTAGSEYKVSYWYKAGSASWPENMKVMIGTAPNAASMTTVLADHPGITTTTYVNGLATFTPTTSGTYYVGFQCYSLADELDLYLDDIQISVVQPVDYALSALVQVNGIPTPFRPVGSVASRLDKTNGGQLAFVRDRSGKGAHSAMPGVNRSVVLPREASPAQTKNTMFVKGNPFNGGASIDATNPITMRATVMNAGSTAPSYNLDFTIAGVPQTTIPRPGIASGTSENVDIIATVADPGTWTTVATATAAGDGDPTNNTATYIRTLVYPTDNIRAHYDNGTNTPSTFIGFGTNNLPLTGGVRFTAPANMRITNVDAFYRNESSTGDVTVKVWAAGNTNNAPGALLYSRTFNTANYIAPGATGDYITLPLEESAPAFGAGSDFWISITYDAAIQYPLGAHSTGITTGRSFVSADGGGTWDPLVISTTEYAWLLRAVGVTSTAFAPVISYTPLPGTGQLTGPTLNATITHPDGINTTSGTSPRIYYKKSTNANVLNDNTSTTDGWKYAEATGVGPFSFAVNYSLLFGGTGVTIGDVIQYFVVAQNLALPPRVGMRVGNFAAEPTSVALTSAAFPVTGTYSYSILPQINSFPYTETFEGATAGWGTEIYSGTVNDWVLGTPAKVQIASAHSGTKAWVTNATANYADNQDAYVVSPLLNFSALTIDPTLEFWHNFYTEAGWDGAVVEYSTDGGSTWARLDPVLGTGTNFTTANSFNWYNSSSTLGPMTPPKFSDVSTVYGGASAGWIKSVTLLSGTAGYSTVRVRWRFASDGSGNNEGWAIDDVSIIPDGAPPAIVYTALGNIGNTTNRVFSGVTITDGSGVNLVPGTRPRVYFKRTTDANVLNDNTPATDGWKYAEATGAGGSPFSFTIDYSLLNGGTGVTFGTSVGYFVVAQDLAVPPNVAINSGTFAAAPVSVALTSAAFPVTGTIYSYTVVPSMAGSYTVGAGGTYGTLKAAFDAINGAVLTGDITLTVTASTTEPAAAVLNQMSYDGGPYTLYLRPPSGAGKLLTPVTISSADAYTIDLNGADNVVIDGRPGGVGTSQDLTIENTSLTGVALRFVNGATNNTVRYSILKGVNTSTSTGVVVLSTSTGAGNSNNVIANCAITAGATWPAVGIYASSSASPANNTNNAIQNCDISDFTEYGLYLLNGVTTTVLEGSSIHQSAPSTGSTVYGVYVGNAPGTTIRKNKIHSLSSTSTASTIEGVEYFGASGVTMTVSIYNNFIALDAAATTNGATIRGIDYYGFAANSVDIDFNSIYIGGTGVTAGTTCALAKRDVAATFNMRDNIAFNARANGTGTGIHYAVYVNNTTATTMVLNNNDYLASGTGGVLGYWATVDQATLAAWQLASGQDAASISLDPQYVGASTANLHVQTASPTSNIGMPITGIVDDIDGEARSTSTPDIGADEFASTLMATFLLRPGWDMVSLPVRDPVGGSTVPVRFPTSTYPFVYEYTTSYQPRTSLENMKGYWAKFSDVVAHTESAEGTRDIANSLGIGAGGWKMVGSLTDVISTNDVSSDPPGLLIGAMWFKYTGSYIPTTTLEPGHGYWVKVAATTNGTLYFTNPSPLRVVGKTVASGVDVKEVLNSVTITENQGASQTLYFGADGKQEIQVDRYAMPPLPPVGAFDARFETSEGGSLVRTHAVEVKDGVEFPVKIQSEGYPLTVSWKIDKGTASYEVTDGLEGRVFRSKEMRGVGSMQLTNSDLTRFTIRLVGDGQLPKEFALEQNYPNPFNPTTSIKYALPVDSRVTMELYNVIGQRVRTLVNDNMPAGYHVAEWDGLNNDGRQLASGVYFLQMSAKGTNGKTFSELKKLMMLK